MEATLSAVEAYLHEHIPLSAAMGVRVKVAKPEHVQLWLPWRPNVNHQGTVFGGSAAAAATLAAWTLLKLRIDPAMVQLVVQRSSMEYKSPVVGDFEAICTFDDSEVWSRFARALTQRGRARLTVAARIVHETREAATFAGDFVALRNGL
jgi:thioesterase domain-containing protein